MQKKCGFKGGGDHQKMEEKGLNVLFLGLKTDKKPNIQTNSLPGKLYEILPATTFETKSVQKVTTANDPPCQYSNHSLVRQILQSCDSHNSGPSFEAGMEWCHNSCDHWVQCEHCKQWYMLPDGMNPASLPDKW